MLECHIAISWRRLGSNMSEWMTAEFKQRTFTWYKTAECWISWVKHSVDYCFLCEALWSFFFSKTGVCATGWCRRSRCRWEYQNNEKKSPPSIRLLLNTVGFRFFSSVHSCKMIHVPFSVPENILGEVCKDKGWFFFSCIPLSFLPSVQ